MKKKVKHKNIRLLTWFTFFDEFLPFLPIAILHFENVTGSFALALAVFSVKDFSTTLFEVPTGLVSDFLGRKKSMILGSLGCTAAFLCFAMASSFWLLVLGAALWGLGNTFYSGNNNALLYDTLKEDGQEEEYADQLGKVSSMSELSLGFSAVVGGLVGMWSFASVFWVTLIPRFTCLVISSLVKEPKKHYKAASTNLFSHLKESLNLFRGNWKLRNLSLGSIVTFGVGNTMFHFRQTLFALLWPIWALGIERFLTHLLGVAGFRYAGKLIKKLSAFKLLLAGTLFDRVIAFLAYGFPTVLSPLLMSITSFTFATGAVAEDSLMQKEFTNHQRATMSSLNSLFGHLFSALFAITVGLVADSIGSAKSLLMGEVILLLVLWIHWRLFRKSP